MEEENYTSDPLGRVRELKEQMLRRGICCCAYMILSDTVNSSSSTRLVSRKTSEHGFDYLPDT